MLTKIIKVVDGRPEFVRPHIQIFDRVEKIGENPMDDLFGARISFLRRHSADDIEEFFNFLGLCELGSHALSPCCSTAVWSSVAIRGDRWRMTTERCHFDLHEGEKWEGHQDLVQFIGLSTSKMLMFAYSPTIRHRWRQVPSRCALLCA